jgi:membrane protein DedA with SNARE-associated domain
LIGDLVGQHGYLGIFLLLLLGGLGLPVPEEAPIILAAVLSHKQTLWGPYAFGACMLGVLAGDFVVYFIGYVYGEKVLGLRLTRKFLTRPREAQIKGYFHRHGFKILILGRFAAGFRTAAYLTAGILKLPPLRLFLTDLVAATLSTSLMFGLGYLFANQIEHALHDVQRAIVVCVALGLAIWLLHRFYKGRMRGGAVVGPKVLVPEDTPLGLPVDDLHSGFHKHQPQTAEPKPVTVTPLIVELPISPVLPEIPSPKSTLSGSSLGPAPVIH